MNDLIELRFINSDATPKQVSLSVSHDSIAPIMTWYGAFHAGDRYKVLANDVILRKDQNGELVK